MNSSPYVCGNLLDGFAGADEPSSLKECDDLCESLVWSRFKFVKLSSVFDFTDFCDSLEFSLAKASVSSGMEILVLPRLEFTPLLIKLAEEAFDLKTLFSTTFFINEPNLQIQE